MFQICAKQASRAEVSKQHWEEGETGHTRKLRFREVKELPSATKLVSAGDRNHTRPSLPTTESLMWPTIPLGADIQV